MSYFECNEIYIPTQAGMKILEETVLFLAIRLLKQWFSKSWNFPRTLMLKEGKANIMLCVNKRGLVSHKVILLSFVTCHT